MALFSSTDFSLWGSVAPRTNPPSAENPSITYRIARNLTSIRHKIHAARREGMAARNTPQREPRPAPRAVNSQSLSSIMRARRIKLASAGHQRRKKSLIHAHGKEQPARRKAQAFGWAFRPVFWMERSNRTSSAASG